MTNGHYETLDLGLDTSDHNRDIRFSYNDDGTLRGIVDFAGRTLTYEYDHDPDQMHLLRATSPAVTYPGNEFLSGRSSAYEYDNGSDPELRHNLLRISDGKEQVSLENSYITEGEFKDAIQTQTYGDGQFRYAYQKLSDDSLLTTETDRNDNVTEWLINTNFDDRDNHNAGHVVKKTEYVELVPGQGLIPLVTTYQHNKWGEKKVEVLPNGNRIEYEYDEDNPDPRRKGSLLEVWRKADANDPGLRTTYTYEPQYNQVKTTTDPRGYEPGNNPADFTTTNIFDYEPEADDDPNTPPVVEVGGNIVRIEYPDAIQADGTTQTNIRKHFGYNEFGQVTLEVQPELNQTEYQYYASDPMRGYLERVIRDPDGIGCDKQYEYDAVGNVVREFDGFDRETTFEVNELNQVQKTISRQVTVGEDRGVWVRYETLNHYDANNNLEWTKISDFTDEGIRAGDILTEFEYDALNNLTLKREWLVPAEPGDSCAPNQCVETTYQYDANENRTLTTLPEGNQTKHTYDERDLVIAETRGFGTGDASTSRTEYDHNGNRLKTISGQGRATKYAYDSYDRLNLTTDAEVNQTTQVYDANGNITEVKRTDASSVTLSRTVNTYDELNRLIRTEADHFDQAGTPIGDGISRTDQYFDKNSRLLRAVDDNGHHTSYAYDALDRRILTTDALDNTVAQEYDCNDNVIAVIETEQGADGPLVFKTTNDYDELDRLIAATDNLGHTQQFTYDSRNNRIKAIDALRNRVKNTYDDLNRLVKVAEELRVGGDGDGEIDTSNPANPDGIISTQIEYDDNDNITARVQDPNGVCQGGGCRIEFAYDALDRLITETYPATPEHGVTTRSFQYDLDDNVIRTSDQNGTVVDNTYDGLNRLTDVAVTPAGGVGGTTVQTYAYDGLSRMTLAYDNGDPVDAADDHTVEWTYDSLSNVRSETHDGMYVVASEHDGVGFRTRLTYPGGRRLYFEPDALNRMLEVCEVGDGCNDSAPLCRFEYVGPTRVAARTMGNGTQMHFTYDGDRRVERILHEREVGSRIVRFDYEYDAMHNRTLKAEQRQELSLPRVSHYAYDSAYRLLTDKFTTGRRGKLENEGEGNKIPPDGVTGTDPFDPPPFDGEPPRAYTYDGVGNRTISAIGDDQTVYSANAMNEYLTVDGVAHHHDANGNLIDDGSKQFAYDFRNRLVLALTPEGTHKYEYDATGRRAAKTVDLGGPAERHIKYILDGAETIEERDQDENLLASFVYSNRIDDILSMAPGQPCTPAPEGLVGWWPAEDSADDLWGSNDGRLRRNANYSEGRVGKAFHFDENGEGVTIQDNGALQFSDAISVEFWLWIDGVQDGADEHGIFQVVDKGHYINGENTSGGWMSEGYLLGNGKAYLMFGIPGLSGAAETYEVTVDEWHHVVGTYRGSTISLYLDGNLAMSNAVAGELYPNEWPVTIGYYYAKTSRWFRGRVDELTIYHRDLTAAEVRAIVQTRGKGKCRPTCMPPPTGTVSWWSGEGNADDLEGRNHGTIHGSVSYAEGMVGQAFHFDGNGQYVQVNAPAGLPLGNAVRTIELWFRTPVDLTLSMEHALVQYGTGSPSRMFGLITSQNAPGKLYFFGQDNDLAGTTQLQANTWYHAAVTYDGNTVKLFVNGQLDAARTVGSLNTVLNSNGLSIGWRPPPGEAWWSGEIDEVTIYDRSLSKDEVKAVYLAGAEGKCPPGGGTLPDLSDHLYFHADALGTITHVTDPDGNLVEAYKYDAFGNLTITDPSGNPIQASAIGNAITYTGRWLDTESDLYIYRARYYNPSTGRFLARDPIAFIDGMNLYTYAINRPTSLVDPNGSDPRWRPPSDRELPRISREYIEAESERLGQTPGVWWNPLTWIPGHDSAYWGNSKQTQWYDTPAGRMEGGEFNYYWTGQMFAIQGQPLDLGELWVRLWNLGQGIGGGSGTVTPEMLKAFELGYRDEIKRQEKRRRDEERRRKEDEERRRQQEIHEERMRRRYWVDDQWKDLEENGNLKGGVLGWNPPPGYSVGPLEEPGGTPKTDPPIKQKMEEKGRPYKVGEGTGE